MRQVDLSHIKVGDKLALSERNRWQEHAPTHRLLIVERVTATQVCCLNAHGGGGEWRFRKSDGKQIGENYRYAEIVTPDLAADIDAKQNAYLRDRAARNLLNDLEGKHLHQLKLTLEQTEALAMAWTAIKAMKPAN